MNNKIMTLKEWSRENNIKHSTAQKWWSSGKLPVPAVKTTHSIIVNIDHIEDDEKYCPGCSTIKKKTEFGLWKTSIDGYGIRCLECKNRENRENNRKNPSLSRKRGQKWYYSNPEKTLAKRLKDDFNLPIEEFWKMYNEQNGLCAICLLPETVKTNTGKTRLLAVDHNHTTGQIRALLCNNCNKAIGHAKENINNLEQMILYLKKHSI